MSAVDAHQPSEMASRSGVARVVLALWVSVCALSLLLIALTIAFHLSTRYDWYFHTTFHPWRMLTVQALAALGAPILGALIVWRRPGNRYGWVWCVFGFTLAVGGAALAYELWALYVAPVQPRGLEAAWLAIVMQPLTLGLFPLLLLLFPDGRPPTPRWRPVVWATLTVCAVWTLATAVAPGMYGFPNPIFWLPGEPGEVAEILAVELWRPYLLLMSLGALSVLARYRRARGRQRQQVKWLAYVAVPLLASFALLLLRWDAIGLLGAVYIAAANWAIYLAIGIAVLRHRLYDIDRLINRTLVYGLLTVLLALVYAGGVFTLGPLLNPADGESALAVAASTLAVAALFQPLRRRVQTAVDRRFNRRRYNAAKTVEAFSGRLREHIGLDTLSTELLAVVDQTMQPTRASVWLRTAANQAGPLTAVATRAAPPAATGPKANQSGPGRGRPTADREVDT
jgi:MFS family permease